MAKDTLLNLRNEIIYCIYVRNHTPEGTFNAIIPDLQRIKGLGADIIWFMPIHPIGETKRKGVEGSPYAIKDYRAVNLAYGTIDDFKALVAAIHDLGMKVMLDVVYNHTSPDSWLAGQHPEWFYRRPNGEMGNKVGEWYDIVDLDYSHPELWDYQIETLKQWAAIVDGFRCDVASLVPLDFWIRARKEVAAVKEGVVWLAESVHPSFLRMNRDRGNVGHSDGELYEAFDITYDYDVHDFQQAYFWGEISLKNYLDVLLFQDGIYPVNYVKLRFLENHDHPRIRSKIEDIGRLRNWTAFAYFQKGTLLLFAGQETGTAHLPDLFEKDPIVWSREEDLTPLLQRLQRFKREAAVRDGSYGLKAADGSETVIGQYRLGNERLTGIFCLDGKSAKVAVDLPDGIHRNLLDDEEYQVRDGILETRSLPILFKSYGEALLTEV